MHFRALSVILFLAACHTDVPMTTSRELPRISVTSDGGITGRGVGGIVVENGQATATLQQKSCTGALTDDERSKLREMAPGNDAEEPGHGTPDQIRYTLRYGERTISWFGENAPKEIAPLFQLLWQIRQRVLASC